MPLSAAKVRNRLAANVASHKKSCATAVAKLIEANIVSELYVLALLLDVRQVCYPDVRTNF